MYLEAEDLTKTPGFGVHGAPSATPLGWQPRAFYQRSRDSFFFSYLFPSPTKLSFFLGRKHENCKYWHTEEMTRCFKFMTINPRSP